MRWFRANQKLGGRLALFALAVQFALAFGHVHPEDIYGPVIAAKSPAAMVELAADHFRPVPPNRPANRTDDYCAICATIYLLGASFVAAAPPLPLPSVSYAIAHVDRVPVAVIASRRAPFQSRAPPLA